MKNEQTIATHKNVDESHKDNVSKIRQIESIIPLYVEFKSNEN